METTGNNKIRLLELDALRGIACLMVVLFHYSIRIDPADPHVLFHHGDMGVDLFFILSGFVIFLTLERTTFWGDFVIHRFSRLYPAYWAAVTLTFLVLYYSPFFTEGTPYWLWMYNMTMLQHWIGVKDIDGAYWTLNLELSFYALMLLLYMLRLLKHVYSICMLLTIPAWLVYFWPENSLLTGMIHWVPVFRMGYLFAAGLLFYKAYKAGGKYSLPDMLLLCICLGTAWFGRGRVNAAEFAHVAVFFLAFFLFTKGRLGFMRHRLLVWLGGLSYTLYLLHENIGWELLKGLAHLGISNWYVSRGLTLVFMIGLSWLVSRYIERPLQRRINAGWRKIKKKKNQPIVVVE